MQNHTAKSESTPKTQVMLDYDGLDATINELAISLTLDMSQLLKGDSLKVSSVMDAERKVVLIWLKQLKQQADFTPVIHN